MNTILVAILVVVGPLLLSYLNGRQAQAKETRDYAREDAVAVKVEEAAARTAAVAVKAEEAADLLLEAQERTIRRTDEVARLQAESTGDIGAQLIQIYTLVNSDMTAMMEALLASLRAQLVLSLLSRD